MTDKEYQHALNLMEKGIRADERAKVIKEVIKTLAESEDTILSDKQYYTLMELKENL